MKEKIDLFIELSLQQCKKDDYADSEKVKIHNKAVGNYQKQDSFQNNRISHFCYSVKASPLSAEILKS